MKRFYKILFFFVLIIFSTNTISAKEFHKDIFKQFNIVNDGKVGLFNKYGKIEIRTWEKDKVKIDIIITVNARNQSDANDLFEKINVDFYNQENYVKAITIIEKMTKGTGSDEYSIDYEVFMPRTCSLELENKYGNTFVANLSGATDVNVKYGNIRLNTVKNDLKIKLQYGNCTVEKAVDTEIEMKYGHIHLKEANNVELNTSHSNVHLGKATDIKCNTKNDIYKLGVVKIFRNEGRYDNLDIQQVEQLFITSSFTDLLVGKLENNADLKMTYGGVIINHVDVDFTDIFLDGKNTEFKLRIDESAEYKLEATGRFCAIKVPDMIKIIQQVENGDECKFKGYQGAHNNAARSIKASIEHGGLKVW